MVLAEDYPPLVNDGAFGPAWFVDSVVEAATPDEEIALLGAVDLRKQAVVSTPVILNEVKNPSAGEEDSITLTSYAPNELRYHYKAATDRLAVFSEIYYPNGWNATVDGQPLNLLRADWTLRAAQLPAGEHDVVMHFLPESYRTGARISTITSILLLLLTLAGLIISILNRRHQLGS